MSKNKTLCVLNTFFNHEHIIKCFESIYSEDVDYFILENKSKYSSLIESYFSNKRIIGYLQSEENITYGTVNYFYKEYRDLINQYEYFTITDGDLLVDDVKSMYSEIFNILNQKNVMVCCVDLHKDNLPKINGSETWIPDCETIDNLYKKCDSGTHMMTFKKENFNVFLDIKTMFDTHIHQHVKEKNGVSAKTLINKAKHLTWDYYYDGNEYYEWKKNNQWTLGVHNKTSKINRLI